MDEITFRSDTVLSDVHLYTPNQRHLMVRLNGMGQPVFLSQFKLLWDRDSQTDSGAKGGDHTEGTPPTGAVCSRMGASLQAGAGTITPEGLEAQLDEDGDLDVVRRPRAASASEPLGPPRDKVHPTILTQEEDDVLGDEAPESSPYNVIKIEHTMATPLEDVGKQVWRGALLLADYILFQRDLFQGRTVLELGAGTGLASIIAATVAQTVYCTDVGADLLAMCQRNIALNSHLLASGGGVVKVKELDWLRDDLCTGAWPPRSGPRSWLLAPPRGHLLCGLDWPAGSCVHWLMSSSCPPGCRTPGGPHSFCRSDSQHHRPVCPVVPGSRGNTGAQQDPEVPFSWSKEDISHLYSHTTILLAAEVFYDDDLTDAVFKTLSRLAHKLKNACTAILSVEKRLNFTLRHLDVTCEAYDHFRAWLQRLEGLAGGRLRFAVEPVDATFPQLLVYERIQQLELWKIFVEPVTDPTVSVDTASQPFS
ncbi:methyltransferase-like protein 22 isoform X1 [Ovis aries]|uniref:methyltransferase-like protein 22 isoform X1 n=1 Tax=Ovis aries TaxID=9940 RepID=UPI001C2ED589|nr:methyltransferase-like protein 22 isoform X1 [Ovis aries]XP_042095837.1 methyltransferase-like protein 22 isoform X1 [Ovis aries]XP_042095839.1 methyltransferase-like protein 22 isoform X1 [Ovis aries]XP_042095840.1 methyltransferase-like protein 22 isoform X1 [Ovis aries]XP_060262050.1 methyltransferase-like protein 22 isoform X1 [Ovis aries]XP_060262051.1 methyltransferase-like protein 22 isoform X1 [Ovis aries]XP_060262052.1 methyltransferase-like protein 22 isoform X1 [Ovis aries]